MKNFTFLNKYLVAAVTLFALINMQSCSSNKGTVSCPDLHGNSHHNMAMHLKMHNGSTQSASTKHKSNTADKATRAQIAPVEKMNPVDGSASLSANLPKSGMEMYKLLTTEERTQVMDKVSTMFAKRPMLNKMISKRFKKLDEQYPAPAQSVVSSHGGLSTGEILAIVAAGLSITFFASIAGMVIGIVALIKIKREGGAKWAKIISIVAIAVGASLFVAFVVWVSLFAVGGFI